MAENLAPFKKRVSEHNVTRFSRHCDAYAPRTKSAISDDDAGDGAESDLFKYHALSF